MTGAEIVAIISVSVGGAVSLLTSCFHSRCTDINCWGIKCKRKIIEDDKELENLNNKL
tara:strand:+ start:208 stop:381 length:174 start_codon:yes stop_codon:yes gene_type:complete